LLHGVYVIPSAGDVAGGGRRKRLFTQHTKPKKKSKKEKKRHEELESSWGSPPPVESRHCEKRGMAHHAVPALSNAAHDIVVLTRDGICTAVCRECGAHEQISSVRSVRPRHGSQFRLPLIPVGEQFLLVVQQLLSRLGGILGVGS
jgi:hypothetical protein